MLSPPPTLPSSHPASASSTPHMTYLSKTPPTSSIHSSSSLGAVSVLGRGGGGGGGGGSELSDFGHSLMAGHSEQYMPHFVLHGTSQPFEEFKDQLVSDLSAMIKVSALYTTVYYNIFTLYLSIFNSDSQTLIYCTCTCTKMYIHYFTYKLLLKAIVDKS